MADFTAFTRDLLDTYGVRLNILGKTALLPSFVQAAVAKAEGITRHNTRCAFSPLSLIPFILRMTQGYPEYLYALYIQS